MFKIVEWGPGFRQEYANGGRQPAIMVGSLAVTVEDPTKVLFWQGRQKMVLKAIPADVAGKLGGKFLLTESSGIHDYKQGDRLVEYLMQHQGEEVWEHFNALDVVDDYRPSQEKIDAWLYAGLVVWTFDLREELTPETHPFGPTLTPHLVPEGTNEPVEDPCPSTPESSV